MDRLKPAPGDAKHGSAPFSALGALLERGASSSFPLPLPNAPSPTIPIADGSEPRPDVTRTPSKSRSFSDSTPKLIPSPDIREAKSSKDDHHLVDPKTPHRINLHQRGLSLQMPPKDVFASLSLNRAPLSPPLPHARGPHGSPSHQVLPRHSRGLDFARACTNLHHSTLADSSPDSSPTITQKGMMIPNHRRSGLAGGLDSHSLGGGWSNHGDRMAATSSLGSIAMLDDESSSSSDEDIDAMDDENDDMILSTPQAMKTNNAGAATPFAAANPFGNNFPGGSAPFMTYQRARLRNNRSRKSSSSASMSGHSTLASPAPASPPNGRADGNNGYFAREVAMRNAGSRRESLSFHTNDLHISSGNDSGDEASRSSTRPSVVRRAVTRRGNLLPKTRAFGRIKDDLIAESNPLDTDIRAEAEVIRQVRESDADTIRPSSSTGPSSADRLSGIPEDDHMSLDNSSGMKGLFGDLSQAFSNREFWNTFEPAPPSSTGASSNDGKSNNGSRAAQPRPPPLFPRGSVASDDISMGLSSPPIIASRQGSIFLPASLRQSTPPLHAGPTNPFDVESSAGGSAGPNATSTNILSRSRATTPQLPPPFPIPPSAADGIRKSTKRRRDDEFDTLSLKRRAVSPGLSVQNSPVLSQSPGSGSAWGSTNNGGGLGKRSREGSVVSGVGGNGNGGCVSNGSGGSVIGTPSLGPKRVGLQGMTDTSDGLMKMSIE